MLPAEASSGGMADVRPPMEGAAPTSCGVMAEPDGEPSRHSVLTERVSSSSSSSSSSAQESVRPDPKEDDDIAMVSEHSVMGVYIIFIARWPWWDRPLLLPEAAEPRGPAALLAPLLVPTAASSAVAAASRSPLLLIAELQLLPPEAALPLGPRAAAVPTVGATAATVDGRPGGSSLSLLSAGRVATTKAAAVGAFNARGRGANGCRSLLTERTSTECMPVRSMGERPFAQRPLPEQGQAFTQGKALCQRTTLTPRL